MGELCDAARDALVRQPFDVAICWSVRLRFFAAVCSFVFFGRLRLAHRFWFFLLRRVRCSGVSFSGAASYPCIDLYLSGVSLAFCGFRLRLRDGVAGAAIVREPLQLRLRPLGLGLRLRRWPRSGGTRLILGSEATARELRAASYEPRHPAVPATMGAKR